MVETKETDIQEMSIPIIGLIKGIWIMITGAFAFIGTAFVFTYALIDPSFDILTKALLGSLLAATIFGCIFGIIRYFTEEQIKYIVINMKIK